VRALSVKVSALQLITEATKYKLDRGGIQELRAVWKKKAAHSPVGGYQCFKEMLSHAPRQYVHLQLHMVIHENETQ
jgi:hypothetical protein